MMKLWLILYGLVYMFLCEDKVSATAQQKLIESLLNESTYNKMERPGIGAGVPTVVDVDIFVSSMSSISESTMNYKVNLFLRQRWKDRRLSFTNHPSFNSTLTLHHESIQKMWKPDLFLKNEVIKGSFHDITVPNVLINLDPDGRILYSQRISTQLSCNMKLNKYPLDNQTCYIEMESYGYKTTEMILRWNHDSPLQVNSKLELPQFNLTRFITGECTVYYTTGAFSCIQVALHFERLTGYYFIQVYIPTILIVMLSWVSFWIEYQSVPARISLGLLTVLTITTKSFAISSNLPKVSYIKAIDVWMFTCTVFVFAAFIEYSVVNVLARKEKEKEKKKENLSKKNESKGIQTVPDEDTAVSVFHHLCTNKALFVERVSRVMFPGAFIIFNFLYWISYLYFLGPNS